MSAPSGFPQRSPQRLPQRSPQATPTRSSAWGWLVLVLILTAAGIAARVHGLYWKPHTSIDSSVIVHQVEVMRDGDEAGKELRDWALYPHLLARATAWLPDPRLPAVERREGPTVRDAPAHMRLAAATLNQIRRASAYTSMLLIPAAFLLARRFLSRRAALFATWLVLTSLLHYRFSTQARPHGIASSAMAWSLVASLYLRGRGGPLAFLAAGAAAGFALGGLHYGVFALPPLLVAAVLRNGGGWGTPRLAVGRTLAGLAAAGAVFALCVRIFYPFHFGAERGFLAIEQEKRGAAINLSGQPLLLEKFDGSNWDLIPRILWQYDPALLLLGTLGLILAAGSMGAGIRREGASPAGWLRSGRARDALVLAAHAIPYTIVISLYAWSWERFVIQLLPVIAIVATFGLVRIAGRNKPLALVLGVTGALAATGVQAMHTFQRGRADSFDRAAQWARANLEPERSRLCLLTTYELPLLYSDEALAANAAWVSELKWLGYQSLLGPGDTAGERYGIFQPPGFTKAQPRATKQFMADIQSDVVGRFRRDRADYVLLYDPRMERPGTEFFHTARAAFAATGAPVWNFSPRTLPGRPARLHQQNIRSRWSDPVWFEVLTSRGIGPTLEIYAMP